MSSGDYFDDEELINDYMEEDFEPPPDYDEAFMEEMAPQEVGGNAKETNVREQGPPPVATQPAAASTDPEPPSMPPQEITTTTPDLRELRDDKTDLFKFERYQGTHEWRKEPDTSADIKAASSWKNHDLTSSLAMHGGATRRSAAPEVQLMEFLNRGQPKRLAISKSQSRQFLPKAGIDSVPVTLADGTRIHVKRNSKLDSKKLLNAGSSGHILGVSMKELLRRSDAIRRKAERRKRVKQIATSEEDPQQEDELFEPETKQEKQNHQLWVDKHAPSVFSHLLSDERTNREVLRALRAWDPYVFHRAPPPRPVIMQQRQAFQKFSPQKNKQPTDGALPEKNKNDTRPDESNRVILLSGPPGVGKTTLAHIVARHAGYRPLEVNSSDERSASVLKERVVRAMESATLRLTSDDGLNGRPNCLILDEIDGADAKGAVAALVDIIRADMPVSKKGKNVTYLRRPIIFICNHKYAPALRPLLPYAKQFDVGPPSSTRLVARLRSVLSEERLSLMGGSSLMHQLVAGTGGDIRSCLYAMQFASARAREVGRKKKLKDSRIHRGATVVDISQALGSALGATGNGLKDERNDVAGTITAVFRKPKKQRLEESVGSSSKLNKKADVERVLRFVESFGDNSKTLDCIFTNLLRVSYVDPTLDRCFAAHEWLSSADIYRSNKTSVASNNFMAHHTMQRFHIPSAAAAVHLLCRVETKADLEFSTRQLTDSRYQTESNAGLVHKFVEGLAPKSRAGAVGINNVVTETIPYSLWLLSAGEGSCSLNRGVSSLEILNNNERLAFDAHVATLRALGLTYVAEEETSQSFHGHSESNTNMRLEPQIDRIVQFQDAPSAKRRKEIPSVLKELLAHGSALESMREREAVAEKTQQGKDGGKNDKQVATTGESLFKKDQGAKSKSSEDKVPSAKHKMPEKTIIGPPAKRPKTVSTGRNFLGIGAAKAKAAKSARKAALVGFDRSKKVKLSNSGSGVNYRKVVRFKYSRGFTQAVRTPCRLEDLV